MLLQLNNKLNPLRTKKSEETLEAEEEASEEAVPEVAEVEPEVVLPEEVDPTKRIGFPLPSLEDSSSTV